MMRRLAWSAGSGWSFLRSTFFDRQTPQSRMPWVAKPDALRGSGRPGIRGARQRVSALLQRRGAHVVDAPPDRLPAALAEAYLALKAAGRL